MLFKELKNECIEWLEEQGEILPNQAQNYFEKRLTSKGKVNAIFKEIKRGLRNQEYKLSKGVLTRVWQQTISQNGMKHTTKALMCQ